MKKYKKVIVLITAMICCMMITGLADEKKKNDLLDRFFALNISRKARKLSIEKRAGLVKKAGYAGYHHVGIDKLDRVLKASDKEGLKFFACYLMIKTTDKTYPAKWLDAIKLLKGRGTILWLAIRGKPSSSTIHDENIVKLIQEIADAAEKTGVKIALYPHFGFYAEKVEDVSRIAGKVNRTNVGVTFNLCHFLRTEPDNDWRKALKKALPGLMAVTISGADIGTKTWDSLIMPLDRGTFDLKAFLDYLDEIGFKGPIGVQDFGITIDPLENLKRSMNAFKKYISR